MTLFYPNHTITVYRNRQKGTSNRFGMSATFTSAQATIEPAAMERRQLFPERWGAVFFAFVDAADDILEGDQILTEDGKLYSVKGVERWQSQGGIAELDHLELTLVAVDA